MNRQGGFLEGRDLSDGVCDCLRTSCSSCHKLLRSSRPPVEDGGAAGLRSLIYHAAGAEDLLDRAGLEARVRGISEMRVRVGLTSDLAFVGALR